MKIYLNLLNACIIANTINLIMNSIIINIHITAIINTACYRIGHPPILIIILCEYNFTLIFHVKCLQTLTEL